MWKKPSVGDTIEGGGFQGAQPILYVEESGTEPSLFISSLNVPGYKYEQSRVSFWAIGATSVGEKERCGPE
jgi:hypothetical protein